MRLTTATGIKESGWSFIVGSEDDFSTFTEDMLREMRAGAVQRMNRALDFYVAEIRKTLGRVSRRQTRNFAWESGRSVAAGAGEPPHRITGDLQRSWVRGTVRWSMLRTVLTGSVESRHPAAGLFEFITAKGALKPNRRGRIIGIRPHPYIRPTLARIADRLEAILVGADTAVQVGVRRAA